jgi:methyltransferase
MVTGSRLFFFALLGAWGMERLFEVALSRRNARRAFARGGVEVESRGFYAAMVAVHGLLFFAAPLEVVALDRPFRPALALAASAAIGAAMALRYWAVATLGDRWNTRVIVVPGEPAVASGPYRWVRHPNYVAVAIEMAALPLVHGAWISALLWSAASALLLALRIPREEAALARASDYTARLGNRPRFLPGTRPRGGGG